MTLELNDTFNCQTYLVFPSAGIFNGKRKNYYYIFFPIYTYLNNVFLHCNVMFKGFVVVGFNWRGEEGVPFIFSHIML